MRQKRIGEEETSRESRELGGSNIDWKMILRGWGRGLIGMNVERMDVKWNKREDKG